MTWWGTHAAAVPALGDAPTPPASDERAPVREANRDAGGAAGTWTEPPSTLGGGRYQLEWLIGRGASSEVFHGHDTLLKRPVAIKLFPTESDGHEAQRRWREVHTLAALNHPRLVSLYDVGDHHGRMFIVLQLVEGGNLSDRLAGGPLTPRLTVRLGGAVAAGLAHIHDRGLIHRDLKPANILLDRAGLPCLTDFGLATPAGAPALTDAGLILGTPAYLAPEQVRGAPLGPPADVYALGLVLLECLTGQRQYPGDPATAAIARLEHPPHIPDQLPEAVTTALRAMTHPQADRRPAATELTTYFAALQGSLPADRRQPVPTTTTAARPDQPQRARPPLDSTTNRASPTGTSLPRDRPARRPAALPPRRPRTAANAAAALILLLAVGGGVAATHAAHTPTGPTASIAVAAAPPAAPQPEPRPGPRAAPATAPADRAGLQPAAPFVSQLVSDDREAAGAGPHDTAASIVEPVAATRPDHPPRRNGAQPEPHTSTRAPAPTTSPTASRSARPSASNSPGSRTTPTKPPDEESSPRDASDSSSRRSSTSGRHHQPGTVATSNSTTPAESRPAQRRELRLNAIGELLPRDPAPRRTRTTTTPQPRGVSSSGSSPEPPVHDSAGGGGAPRAAGPASSDSPHTLPAGQQHPARDLVYSAPNRDRPDQSADRSNRLVQETTPRATAAAL